MAEATVRMIFTISPHFDLGVRDVFLMFMCIGF